MHEMTDIDMRITNLERHVKKLEELANITDRLFMDEAAERRENTLVDQYGEHVNKSTAAKILGVCRATVYTLLDEGRLQGACEGKRVSTRSIARFICSNKRREKKPHDDENS